MNGSASASQAVRQGEAVAEAPRATAAVFLYGLLVVQIVVGLEFFVTVLTKLVRGGFVSGLGADLQDRVQAAPAWYRSFAENVVIPHATLFGYLIIVGELFVGVTLITTAVVWFVRWPRLSVAARSALVMAVILAALAGLAMTLNYHIANGATNLWQLGESPFDEAVDINTVLTLIEATIVVVMCGILVSLRRGGRPSE
jgi:uncharacterized membrane protein YphA (DoxX/SURF4 family)